MSDGKDGRLPRVLYDKRPSVQAYSGVSFKHQEATLPTTLKNYHSMPVMVEYKENEITATDSWSAFYEGSIALRQENLPNNDNYVLLKFEIKELISMSYDLRVIRLSTQTFTAW